MEIGEYLRYPAALLFVLGLIAALAWLARRSRLGAGPAAGGRRLAVVEAVALDARRRLVLVRRDSVEHLLLLGADRDLVVEVGIPEPPATGNGGALSGTDGPGYGSGAPESAPQSPPARCGES